MTVDNINPNSVDVSLVFAMTSRELPIPVFSLQYTRWIEGDGTSFVSTLAAPLTALALIVTPHTDEFGIYLSGDLTGGSSRLLRVDFPDAAFSSGADFVVCNVLDDSSNVVAHRIFSLTADTTGYYGAIWYDAGAGNTGTVFGVDGTAINPVSDSESAKTLLALLGTKLVIIEGTFTLTSNWHDLTTFRGRGLHSEVDGNSQDGGDNVYRNLVVTGIQVADDETIFTDCLIDGAVNIAGLSRRCVFDNNNTIGSNNNGLLVQEGSPLNQATTFDMAGTMRQLNLQGWKGDATITNMNDVTAILNIIMYGGTITITNCQSGMITIAGEGNIIVTGLTGASIDTSAMGVQHWRGFDLNLGPNMVEDDGGSNPRWTAKALEEVDFSQTETDLTEVLNRIGTPVALDGGSANLASNLTKMADDNNGLDFVSSTDSLAEQGNVQFVKNVAFANFTFLMVNNTDHVTGVPGLTVTGEILQDSGAFGAVANLITDKGNGFYQINLTQSEMNADSITLLFTATGADDRSVTFPTNS